MGLVTLPGGSRCQLGPSVLEVGSFAGSSCMAVIDCQASPRLGRPGITIRWEGEPPNRTAPPSPQSLGGVWPRGDGLGLC